MASFSFLSSVMGLQEAAMKDTLERAREPNLNLKGFLQSAYVHPAFKDEDGSEKDSTPEESETTPDLVPTKRHSRKTTPLASKHSSSFSSSVPLVSNGG